MQMGRALDDNRYGETNPRYTMNKLEECLSLSVNPPLPIEKVHSEMLEIGGVDPPFFSPLPLLSLLVKKQYSPAGVIHLFVNTEHWPRQ